MKENRRQDIITYVFMLGIGVLMVNILSLDYIQTTTLFQEEL